jgi:hypothetical protein
MALTNAGETIKLATVGDHFEVTQGDQVIGSVRKVTHSSPVMATGGKYAVGTTRSERWEASHTNYYPLRAGLTLIGSYFRLKRDAVQAVIDRENAEVQAQQDAYKAKLEAEAKRNACPTHGGQLNHETTVPEGSWCYQAPSIDDDPEPEWSEPCFPTKPGAFGQCSCGERLIYLGEGSWAHADNGLDAQPGCGYNGPWA